MKVVILDCDHGTTDVELEVATRADAVLEVTHCRDEDDVIAAAAGADAVVSQYAPLSARVIHALPKLRAIGRYGVGVDVVDVPAATAHGIVVCNVPDYCTAEVAEHTLALALSALRGVTRLDRNLRSGVSALGPVGPLNRLGGRTFGVIGLGGIGREVARRASALGFEVVGYDAFATAVDGVEVVDLDTLLERSHVVSLHVPLTAETERLINAERLLQMRRETVLVNTCRGGVVDTGALVDALRAGTLAGAALDVLDVEPVPADHPLLALDQVILTPHAAWYSEESVVDLKRRVIENVIDACTGRRPRNVVNPEVLDAASVTS